MRISVRYVLVALLVMSDAAQAHAGHGSSDPVMLFAFILMMLGILGSVLSMVFPLLVLRVNRRSIGDIEVCVDAADLGEGLSRDIGIKS